MIATLLVPDGIALPLSVQLLSLTTRTSDCTGFGGPGQPTVSHCIGKWLTIPSSSALLLVVLVIVPALVAVNVENVQRSRYPLSA